MNISKAAVLGAGTMGAAIAAHLAHGPLKRPRQWVVPLLAHPHQGRLECQPGLHADREHVQGIGQRAQDVHRVAGEPARELAVGPGAQHDHVARRADRSRGAGRTRKEAPSGRAQRPNDHQRRHHHE